VYGKWEYFNYWLAARISMVVSGLDEERRSLPGSVE
jgi:hypothetical protein